MQGFALLLKRKLVLRFQRVLARTVPYLKLGRLDAVHSDVQLRLQELGFRY
jgi:hypothetical protein